MLAATLRALLYWWMEQIASLAPTSWRTPAGREPDGLLLVANETCTRLEILARKGGVTMPLTSATVEPSSLASAADVLRQRGGAMPVILTVPGEAVLERSATLPLLAEKNAGQALGYDLDRLTPFSVDEVFWTWSLLSRDRAQGRLWLKLVLIPRARWSPLLEALSRASIVPSWIEGRGADNVLHRIALGSRARRGGLRLRTTLAWSCVVLAGAALITPVVKQTIELDGVNGRIAALRPLVARVETIQRQIMASSTGLDVIAAETARLGSPLQALATLTNVLPDDTYLTDFTVHQRKLTMNGQSAAATQLIGALSADPALRNPAFIAPVTRSETGKADLFAIRAELGS